MFHPLPEPLTLAQALSARAAVSPDGEILRLAGGRPWTAGELWGRAAAWAEALTPIVTADDVVMTSAAAGPDAVALSAAVSALGGVELPLAPDATGEWVDRLIRTTDAVALVATPEREQSRPDLAALSRGHGVPLLRTDRLPTHGSAGGGTLRPRARAATDPALVLSTSGTTGRTKAALLPVGAPYGQACRVAEAMAYTPDDVLFSCFPWHHVNARNACVLPALLSGARVVVAPRFSASGFLDLARREHVTAFNFMGALCGMLLARPASGRDRDHHIRKAYGGPAPAELVAAFHDRFGVTLRQAYACTELGDVSLTAVDELVPGAAGRVADDYEVRVVDGSRQPVPPGRTGELLVRPRREGLAFLGYVGDEQATRDAWEDGWFRTRDRGRVDDGWLWVDGRLGDAIRRRGVNIDPRRIEEVLLAHPDVTEVAAVAVPSELTEDEVLAVVVLAPGCDVQPPALRAHCRDALPRHMVPRFISIESDLPHNGSLKLDRAALRRRGLPPTAWDGDDRTTTTTRPEAS
jgi:crotonobetaine/carnitine-CoA ligase